MLFTVFMYTVSACNMWILAEALYLTMLVQSPLVTERKGVRVYVVMGWGKSGLNKPIKYTPLNRPTVR